MKSTLSVPELWEKIREYGFTRRRSTKHPPKEGTSVPHVLRLRLDGDDYGAMNSSGTGATAEEAERVAYERALRGIEAGETFDRRTGL
jgi:hypothetical protein